jgi:Transposase IS66 family
MSPRADLSGLSNAELKALVEKLLGEIAELKQTVWDQAGEIARLKGLSKRPKVKPSGMAQAAEKKRIRPDKRKGSGKTARLVIDETRVLKAAVPAGSRFKGYEDVVVQDLILRRHVVRFRRERWMTPEGATVIAPLPAGVTGHFGPELRRFILAQHHQGQVTMPRLLAQLRAIGIDISKRQVVRLLIAGQERFIDESREVLRAGLAHARWITVDDTGARHKAVNGYCTQIGNDHFTWFGTTGSKSRINFLELLRAGYGDYVVSAEALDYMRRRALSGTVIALLTEAQDHVFADRVAWQAHLDGLGITALAVTPNPVQIATEGALWGSIKAHGFLPDTSIISDDAGQFNVGRHALCWIHAERLVHKLNAVTPIQLQAQQRIRGLIWWLYFDLKAFRNDPTPRRRTTLKTRFVKLCRQRTSFTLLDRLLGRLLANKDELLRVLDHPEIPLHTNGSENDIRSHVTKRQISGGTRSDPGRDCRDAFLGLGKTATKLGYSFWDYLADRLQVPGHMIVPYLPDLVRQRCQFA